MQNFSFFLFFLVFLYMYTSELFICKHDWADYIVAEINQFHRSFEALFIISLYMTHVSNFHFHYSSWLQLLIIVTCNCSLCVKDWELIVSYDNYTCDSSEAPNANLFKIFCLKHILKACPQVHIICYNFHNYFACLGEQLKMIPRLASQRCKVSWGATKLKHSPFQFFLVVPFLNVKKEILWDFSLTIVNTRFIRWINGY